MEVIKRIDLKKINNTKKDLKIFLVKKGKSVYATFVRGRWGDDEDVQTFKTLKEADVNFRCLFGFLTMKAEVSVH